jgi:hypothetical protein
MAQTCPGMKLFFKIKIQVQMRLLISLLDKVNTEAPNSDVYSFQLIAPGRESFPTTGG